jgi:hypothetical protein
MAGNTLVKVGNSKSTWIIGLVSPSTAPLRLLRDGPYTSALSLLQTRRRIIAVVPPLSQISSTMTLLLSPVAQQPKHRRRGKRGGKKSQSSHSLPPSAAFAQLSVRTAAERNKGYCRHSRRSRIGSNRATRRTELPQAQRQTHSPLVPSARGSALFAQNASKYVVIHYHSLIYYIFAGTSAGLRHPNVAAVPHGAKGKAATQPPAPQFLRPWNSGRMR